MTTAEISSAATTLLSNNHREKDGFHFTVPSPELYPFQWLWDSCFHAFIFNALGQPEAAERELSAACARPLPNGLLPHIIYWEPLPEDVRWGREQRSDAIDAAWGTHGTSTITQPPLIVRAVLETYERSGDHEWLSTLYPTLLEYLGALAEDRTYQDTELAVIINPDESGEDNSPRYDALLSLPPQHSPDLHLDKRILMMKQLAVCEYKVKTCMVQHFAVVDVGFNAIYLDALLCLAKITDHLNEPYTGNELRARAARLKHAMRSRLKHDEHWYALNALTHEPLEIATWNEFMPLFAGIATTEEADQLVKKLFDTQTFMGDFGLRTTAATEPSYDPDDGFWRGPIWAAPYWFIARGLRRYGYHDEVIALRAQLQTLITTSGWREHYHPETGTGLGAHNFTWSGLVLDM